MKYLRTFLLNSQNIQRDSYIWNMIGSTIMAFQSVLLLMILTRTVGLADSGIFTIAYANANLLLALGKYGMHNYHVSDTSARFSFAEYRASRGLTSVAMMVAGVVLTLFSAKENGYSSEKSLVMIWMCIFKAVDAVEDVYLSFYQQQGRLDVSGKEMSVRLIGTTIFFVVCVLVTGRLLPALIGATVFTAAFFVFLNHICYGEFRAYAGEKVVWSKVLSLLRLCFPLFLGGFLSYYVTNAPKYAIDAILSDEHQACYGFISMPVFVIGLLNNYIFNPTIRPMSEKWKDGDIKWFVKLLLRQSMIAVGITTICVAGAYVLGIPVLSVLYSTDLSSYKMELIVLLLGGGFLAVSGLLMTVATIIRYQKYLLIGYGLCAALAYVFAEPMVARFSVMGAAVLNLLLMVIMCVIFAIILAIGIGKRNHAIRAEKGITR